jgi:hypothetical protein
MTFTRAYIPTMKIHFYGSQYFSHNLQLWPFAVYDQRHLQCCLIVVPSNVFGGNIKARSGT